MVAFFFSVGMWFYSWEKNIALLYLDNLYAYEIICEIICDIMVHPQIQIPAHLSF